MKSEKATDITKKAHEHRIFCVFMGFFLYRAFPALWRKEGDSNPIKTAHLSVFNLLLRIFCVFTTLPHFFAFLGYRPVMFFTILFAQLLERSVKKTEPFALFAEKHLPPPPPPSPAHRSVPKSKSAGCKPSTTISVVKAM